MAQILLIITLFLFLLYAGLLLYYRIAWNRVPAFQPPQADPDAGASANAPGIVVIIPARNEAANIGPCLESLRRQDYPADCFRIVVVDDHSTDDTAARVEAAALPNLQLIRLAAHLNEPGTLAYKKKALETGIRLSQGELIVTTDADCVAPARWLSTLAAFYRRYQPALIVMPVRYHHDNRPMAIFESLDFMTLQGITAAAVNSGFHSMCNGANLAYTRSAFEAVNGFAGTDHIASGDDMLLMHKIAKRFPDQIRYLLSPSVIMETSPAGTLRRFFRQRIRWASKADQYQDPRIFLVLLLVYLFNVMMLVLPLVGLLVHPEPPVLSGLQANLPVQPSLLMCGLVLLAAKTAVELVFLYPVARFFGRRRLLWFFPLAQPFHLLYTVIAGWLGKFGRYQWKGREVR